MRKSKSVPKENGAPVLRTGIKSLETALSVLTKLSTLNRAASLTELSHLTGMPPSKIHRYLASFINVGLVTQRHRSGRYDLGKAAVELGLAAMARIEMVNRAADRLEDITERTKAAALLAVWGTQGPTIVRWQRIPTVIVSSLGLGTTMPLLNSASGRIFLAFAEESLIASQLERELKHASSLNLRWPDLEPTRGGVRRLRETIRRNGYSTDQFLIPGVYAISVPVLNWQDEVEAAVTVVNTDPRLIDPKGPALEYLLQVRRDVSIVAPTGIEIPPIEHAPKQSRTRGR
jgi:DNA-binding IclR family transcriptional regulator